MSDHPANPDSGAAGTQYQTIEALRRLGHEIDAVWADGLPHRIRHWNLHYLLELPRALRATMLTHMHRTRYDAIDVSQPHGYLAAKAVARREGGPVFIHRSHGFELRVKRELAKWLAVYGSGDARPGHRVIASRMMSALLDRHSRAIARYASGHIVSAEECARFLVDEMRVPEERVCVIPQAAPLSYVSKPAEPMTRERSRRLLYVGQFAFIKAPMIVAAALNRVLHDDEETTATWVTSRAHHRDVTALLDQYVRSRVTLRDWMPQQELMNVYDRHGIFLFPSFFEGFGKAFMEAMARGLCVIASDTGGAKDVITNDYDGFLVPTGDADATIRQCVELLRSESRCIALSSAAANRAREFSWDRVARETVAFYHRRLQ